MIKDDEMEKRGVSCTCDDGHIEHTEDLVKTASGYSCKHCGRIVCVKENKEKVIDTGQ